MNISKLIAPVLLGALLLPLAANAQSVNARQDEQRPRFQHAIACLWQQKSSRVAEWVSLFLLQLRDGAPTFSDACFFQIRNKRFSRQKATAALEKGGCCFLSQVRAGLGLNGLCPRVWQA